MSHPETIREGECCLVLDAALSDTFSCSSLESSLCSLWSKWFARPNRSKYTVSATRIRIRQANIGSELILAQLTQLAAWPFIHFCMIDNNDWYKYQYVITTVYWIQIHWYWYNIHSFITVIECYWPFIHFCMINISDNFWPLYDTSTIRDYII